jgi:hypothetical protein
MPRDSSAAGQSLGINRDMGTAPEPGSPGALLSSPLFVLRLTEVPATRPSIGPAPGAPATKPGTDVNAGPDSDTVNPAMVQGTVAAALNAQVLGQSADLKNAMVSDNYLKLATELATLAGPQTASDSNSTDKPVFGAPGSVGTGQEIDPLTGKPRMIAVLQKPALPTATGPSKPAEPTQPGVSARGLANVSTSELVAGSRVKPVRLAPEDSTGGSSLSSYDLTMAKAEQALKAGKYLDAAETYQAALGIKPEDPLALVGRAHAEFGAGLYTSAAHDLKFVFIRKPELVSVHYDVASFIPATRQEYLMKTCRS